MSHKPILWILLFLLAGSYACTAHPTPGAPTPSLPPPSPSITLPSPTSSPTITPTPTAAPVTQTPTLLPATPAAQTLVEQIGFLDAAIQKIQAEEDRCRLVDRRETSYQNDLYTAYIISCRVMSHLLVYQQPASASGTKLQLALNAADVDFCFHCTISGENWRDVDQDGRPDLITGQGNNYYFTNQVYRMNEAGKLENLLKICPLQQPGMYNPSFEDVDQDGDWELTAIDTRWDYYTIDFAKYLPKVTHIYTLQWHSLPQSCQYQDVSTEHSQVYQSTIDHFFRTADDVRLGAAPREVTLLSIVEGLLACEMAGRRDECWPLFLEATDLEMHPLETLQGPVTTPDASMIQFTQWIQALRAHLQKQYEAGLPFSPMDQ